MCKGLSDGATDGRQVRLSRELEKLASALAVVTFDKEKLEKKAHLLEDRLSTVMAQQVVHHHLPTPHPSHQRPRTRSHRAPFARTFVSQAKRECRTQR